MAAVDDVVTALRKVEYEITQFPADAVLAVVDTPEFPNELLIILIVPADVCVKYAMPVVPKSPAQSVIFIRPEGDEVENVIPVLFEQFR